MLGVMERDGVTVVAAYGFLVATVVYFALFATAVIELILRLRQHLGFSLRLGWDGERRHDGNREQRADDPE